MRCSARASRTGTGICSTGTILRAALAGRSPRPVVRASAALPHGFHTERPARRYRRKTWYETPCRGRDCGPTRVALPRLRDYRRRRSGHRGATLFGLSPQYDKDTVGIHVARRREHQAVEQTLVAVEEVLALFAPRPHRGKLFLADAATLATRYPRLADFVDLAHRFDPNRKFTNDGWCGSVCPPAAESSCRRLFADVERREAPQAPRGCRKTETAIFQAFLYGSDGTRTRDLRRDRPVLDV